MTKHPAIGALVISAALSVVLAGAVLVIYSAQEAPWALAAVVLALPIMFLSGWMLINALACWKDALNARERPGFRVNAAAVTTHRPKAPDLTLSAPAHRLAAASRVC